MLVVIKYDTRKVDQRYQRREVQKKQICDLFDIDPAEDNHDAVTTSYDGNQAQEKLYFTTHLDVKNIDNRHVWDSHQKEGDIPNKKPFFINTVRQAEKEVGHKKRTHNHLREQYLIGGKGECRGKHLHGHHRHKEKTANKN